MSAQCGAIGAVRCDCQTSGGCSFDGECRFKCGDETMSSSMKEGGES